MICRGFAKDLQNGKMICRTEDTRRFHANLRMSFHDGNFIFLLHRFNVLYVGACIFRKIYLRAGGTVRSIKQKPIVLSHGLGAPRRRGRSALVSLVAWTLDRPTPDDALGKFSVY